MFSLYYTHSSLLAFIIIANYEHCRFNFKKNIRKLTLHFKFFNLLNFFFHLQVVKKVGVLFLLKIFREIFFNIIIA